MKLFDFLFKISQERYGDTAFGETAFDIKQDIDKMKGKWIYQIIGTFIVSVLGSGTLVQILRSILGKQDTIIIARIFTAAFGSGLPFTLIIFFVSNYLCYVFRRATSKDYVRVEDGNYEISLKGTYGTASEMTKEERKEVFYIAPIEDSLWTILGADRQEEDKLYCLKHLHDEYIGVKTFAGINPHIMLVGTSMSGKTYSVIIPTIMQAIRRGESIITTSPKAELYEFTSSIARANDYKIRILNLNPDQLQYSDSIHYLKYAIKDPSDEDEVMKDVISFARTIIDNTRSEGEKIEKFFEDCTFSLLQSIILWLVLSPDIPESEKTLGNVYMKLAEWGVSGVLANLGHLPKNHPASRTFRTFLDSSDSVRQSAVTGLLLKLQILGAKKVRRITDYDSISLTDPGEEKCIYYIGLSADEKNTLKFLVSLYFSIQFQALIKLAKSKYSKQGERLPINVNFILDEFVSCGFIPEMKEKISVVRSYGISLLIALQDINQIQSIYPLNNEWQSILSQCATHIVLKTNDPVTEDYYSIKSGTSTVITKNDRYQEGRADLFKAHPQTYKTEGSNKRPALNPDEINRLKPNELLVFIAGYNYIKLHKYGMHRHPMYKEIVKEYITDYVPVNESILNEDVQKQDPKKSRAEKMKALDPDKAVNAMSSYEAARPSGARKYTKVTAKKECAKTGDSANTDMPLETAKAVYNVPDTYKTSGIEKERSANSTGQASIKADNITDVSLQAEDTSKDMSGTDKAFCSHEEGENILEEKSGDTSQNVAPARTRKTGFSYHFSGNTRGKSSAKKPDAQPVNEKPASVEEMAVSDENVAISAAAGYKKAGKAAKNGEAKEEKDISSHEDTKEDAKVGQNSPVGDETVDTSHVTEEQKATSYHKLKKRKAILPESDGPVFSLEDFDEYSSDNRQARKVEKDEKGRRALENATFL